MDYCDSVGVAQLEHLKAAVVQMLKTDLIAPALPRARRDALFPDLRSRLEKIPQRSPEATPAVFSRRGLPREAARLGTPRRVCGMDDRFEQSLRERLDGN